MATRSGCSIVAASRNENRENGSVDLRAAWVACDADIVFGGQAFSFGVGDCGMDAFDVATLSGRGGTRGSASGGGYGDHLRGDGGSKHAHLHRHWMDRDYFLAKVQTRWREGETFHTRDRILNRAQKERAAWGPSPSSSP